MAVVIAVCAAEDQSSGEQQGGSDEYDPGDDHHPGGDHVEARRLLPVLRPGRRRGRNRSRRGGGFGCITHTFEYGPPPEQRKGARSQSCRELMKPGAHVERRAIGGSVQRPGVGEGVTDGATEDGTWLGPPGPAPGPTCCGPWLPGNPERCIIAGWCLWCRWCPPPCPAARPSRKPVKKMTETMNTTPATMATQAAALKTLGVRCSTRSTGGGGATAVEVRVVGVSEISLMTRMMQRQTVVAAMRWLCSSCELETARHLRKDLIARQTRWVRRATSSRRPCPSARMTDAGASPR